MSAKSKPGDRVVADCEIINVGAGMVRVRFLDGMMRWLMTGNVRIATPPPAPKAVPTCARCGSTRIENELDVPPAPKAEREPVASPEPKREWQVGDVVTNKERPEWGEAEFIEAHPVKERDECTVLFPNGTTAFWFTSNLVLVRAAPTPEPAKLTPLAHRVNLNTDGSFDELVVSSSSGGALVHAEMMSRRAIFVSVGDVRLWAYVTKSGKVKVTHTEPALAAIPPARGEREVVGYYLRDTWEAARSQWLSSANWTDREDRRDPVPREKAVKMRTVLQKNRDYAEPGRLVIVKVTRAVRAKQ